jgi:hypothetical protein
VHLVGFYSILVKVIPPLYEFGVACESNIPPLKIVPPTAVTKSETNLHHKPSHFWGNGTKVKEYLPE